MSAITPFTITVSDSAISDLKQRLANTRWPDQINDDNWSYGTELSYLQELVHYWRTEFDWNQQQQALNQFDHYITTFDGLSTHYIHQRSPHTNATPILLTHGWPGCVVEFQQLIPRLTEPEKFGGKPEQAFHVVCPSLPGYGWSQAATKPGMDTRAIAKRHTRLMRLLGYDSYIAQGGDWGAFITRHTADVDPEHCKAIHLNMVLATPPAEEQDPLAQATEQEREAFTASQVINKNGMGYFKIQNSRPQTLAYGLTDSPAGLCGWITEKFREWTDCKGDIRNAVSWDQLLTIVSIYWFTNSIASSVRLYREEWQTRPAIGFIEQPTGVAIYPREIVQSPRAWIEANYNLQHYFKSDRGGHFAALEQPDVFAQNMWDFNRALNL